MKKVKDHEWWVGFRREFYTLYEGYGIKGSNLNFFGPLSYIIRAHIIQELYNERVDRTNRSKLEDFDAEVYWLEYEWMGGCEREASLDFELRIPSEKKKEVDYYLVYAKAVKRANPDVFYLKSITHACPSQGYHQQIQRFTPCKHKIAVQLILQDRATDWCNERGGVYAGKSIWKKYDKNKQKYSLDFLLASQHPISPELRALYDELTKDKVKSLDREERLLDLAVEEFYKEGDLS